MHSPLGKELYCVSGVPEQVVLPIQIPAELGTGAGVAAALVAPQSTIHEPAPALNGESDTTAYKCNRRVRGANAETRLVAPLQLPSTVGR